MLLSLANILTLWFARFSAWTSHKTGSLVMSGVAVAWCALGLAGSGFDHSVANAAAASEDMLIDAPDVFAWSSMIGDMVWAALASVVAGITVLALSLWLTPSAAKRTVAPQRHAYDVFGAAD